MFKFYLIFFLLFSLKSLSFDYKKDLADVSVNNGFIDENRKIYPFPDDIDKSKVILILWHHGYGGKEWTIDECWRPDPVILKLNNKKIKDKVIKIYSLCSGVRGLNEDEWDSLYDYWLDKSNGDTSKCVNVKKIGKQRCPKIMDFSKARFQGSKGLCTKYKWARKCDITWDGISQLEDPCSKNT